MTRLPELIIGYDESYFPTSAGISSSPATSSIPTRLRRDSPTHPKEETLALPQLTQYLVQFPQVPRASRCQPKEASQTWEASLFGVNRSRKPATYS
jgi:hypothetical protein